MAEVRESYATTLRRRMISAWTTPSTSAATTRAMKKSASDCEPPISVGKFQMTATRMVMSR